VRSTRPVLLVPVPGRFSGHIRTVLVPVDPQGEARAALPWAEEIAAGSGARVHMVTVVPTPATVPPEDAASAVFLPQATGAVLELASEAAREALHQLQASLREQGIQVEAQIRRAAVADCQPDLVVMATHARGGWDSFWAGSVVARFTPSLTVPVLLVPVGAEDAPRAAERQPSPRA
jgi:nucleotide-binding universal stress UspA family protein